MCYVIIYIKQNTEIVIFRNIKPIYNGIVSRRVSYLSKSDDDDPDRINYALRGHKNYNLLYQQYVISNS